MKEIVLFMLLWSLSGCYRCPELAREVELLRMEIGTQENGNIIIVTDSIP